jgi:hypothetical protein
VNRKKVWGSLWKKKKSRRRLPYVDFLLLQARD